MSVVVDNRMSSIVGVQADGMVAVKDRARGNTGDHISARSSNNTSEMAAIPFLADRLLPERIAVLFDAQKPRLDVVGFAKPSRGKPAIRGARIVRRDREDDVVCLLLIGVHPHRRLRR